MSGETHRVAEAYHQDAGRGIARVDMETMKRMGLVSGDIVVIEGKHVAPAIVWPGHPGDTGKGILRIDGNIRANAGVAIDERVKIRKVEAKDARRIVVAPTQSIRIMGGDKYIQRILEGRPVVKGQKLRVEMLGNPLTLVVVWITPSGIVLGKRDTKIQLLEEPVGELKTSGWVDMLTRVVEFAATQAKEATKDVIDNWAADVILQLGDLPDGWRLHQHRFHISDVDSGSGILYMARFVKPVKSGSAYLSAAIENIISCHHPSENLSQIFKGVYPGKQLPKPEIGDASRASELRLIEEFFGRDACVRVDFIKSGAFVSLLGIGVEYDFLKELAKKVSDTIRTVPTEFRQIRKSLLLPEMPEKELLWATDIVLELRDLPSGWELTHQRERRTNEIDSE